MRRTVKTGAANGVTYWPAVRPEVTESLLAEITRRIVDSFQPEKVVLFGSYAYGTPNVDSDLDLLVVMNSAESKVERMMRVSKVARVPFLPMDVLVYTPAEIEERLRIGDFFVKEILERGKVLYQSGTD